VDAARRSAAQGSQLLCKKHELVTRASMQRIPVRLSADAVARRGVVGVTPSPWWDGHPPFSSEVDGPPSARMRLRYAKDAFAAVALGKPRQGIRTNIQQRLCSGNSQSRCFTQ